MTPFRAKIAIIEDDRVLSDQIAWSLKRDYQIVVAGDRDEGMRLLRSESPDLVLLDMHLPPSGGLEEGLILMREARRRNMDTVFVMMSGSEQRESAHEAIREGAYDFFSKPFDLSEVRLIIQRALDRLQIERENRHLRQELQSRYTFGNIVGTSTPMQKVFEAIRKVAETPVSVMLRGESGTGKELVARAIHFNSPKRNGPFIGINCGAIPVNLVESELFGHERGAFTGAVATRKGRFELADGGTLFLDEIGTLPPDLQTRLLRVLETRRFERVGGSETLESDFRLISASHEDLERRIAEGAFRQDLYYRLRVFPILIPPLRERREDIPLLVDHFLRTTTRSHGLRMKHLEPEALQMLMDAPWPGNVRELENLVQTMALMLDGSRIRPGDLAPLMSSATLAGSSAVGFPRKGISLEQEMDRRERELLDAALERAGGTKTEAARLLGIDKNRMMYLCKKHGLSRKMKYSSSWS